MLIGDQKTGRMPGVEVSASQTGIRVTVNGKPARLALVMDDGPVIAPVPELLEKEVFAVAVNAYRDFLRGEGHLRSVSPVAP